MILNVFKDLIGENKIEQVVGIHQAIRLLLDLRQELALAVDDEVAAVGVVASLPILIDHMAGTTAKVQDAFDPGVVAAKSLQDAAVQRKLLKRRLLIVLAINRDMLN